MFTNVALWATATIVLIIPCLNARFGVFASTSPVTCFKCDHLTRPSTCNVTTTCQDGEICAVRKYQGQNGEYHSSGCIAETQCKVIDKVKSSAQLVGKRHYLRMGKGTRQTDTLVCEKCCYGNMCNVLDCTITTLTSTICVDKVSQCSDQIFMAAICQDDNNAILFCQKSCGKCPIDGGFSNWLSWSDCSLSCGGQGQMIRVRACNNPKPQNNGQPCHGQTMETKTCDNGPCPVDGNWSPWSQWSSCNATCGGGTSIRIRSCSDPVPRYGGKSCPNPASFLQMNQCNNQSCPIDGNWSPWSPWSHCTATCGGGTTSRIRSCSDPVPRYGGIPCPNPASFRETKQCNNHTCKDQSSAFPVSSPLTVLTSTPVHVTMSSAHCQDQKLCSDPHMRQIACNDLYLSKTFCPRMCHMCGPTVSPPTCNDMVGSKCQEKLFKMFTCSDSSLADLCRQSCGLCHH